MPNGAILVGVELAKLALQIYFRSLEMAGKTPEEMEVIFQAEKMYFLEHPPSSLPDVEV